MSDEQLLRMARNMAAAERRIQRLEVQDRPEGGGGGTASMSAAEILTALQTVDGTGSGLDADLLDGYQAAAFAGTAHTHTGYAGTAEVTAGTILAKLLTVDGTGSGLDADLLDGAHGTAFAAAGHAHTGYAGTAEVTAGTILAKLLTVDGAGSGLDADLLDGQHGSAFVSAGTLTNYLRADGATPLSSDWNAGSASRMISAQVFRAEMFKPTSVAGLTLRDYTSNAPMVIVTDGSVTFGSAAYTAAVNVVGSLAVQGTAVSVAGHTHSAYAGTAEVTAGTILAKMLTVDGNGSEMDADLLDGLHATAFSGTAHTHSYLPLSGGTVSGAFLVVANGANTSFVGTDHCYLQFYPDGVAAGRKAYIGIPSASSDDFTIANQVAGGGVALNATTPGTVLAERARVESTGLAICGPGAAFAPSGILHAYNGSEGMLGGYVTNVGTTPVSLLGTAQAVRLGLNVVCQIRAGTAIADGGFVTIFRNPAGTDTAAGFTSGGNTFQFRILGATGAVDVRRTAGGTAGTVGYWLFWS
jgi:hypothetical protein